MVRDQDRTQKGANRSSVHSQSSQSSNVSASVQRLAHQENPTSLPELFVCEGLDFPMVSLTVHDRRDDSADERGGS